MLFRFPVLLLLMVCASAAFAQWTPVPWQTTQYVAQPSTTNMFDIEALRWDSMSADSSLAYFANINDRYRDFSCFAALEQSGWWQQLPPRAVQSIAGGVWFFGDSLRPFHTDSEPGFTWLWEDDNFPANLKYIKFEHLETRLDTIWGVEDSVKLYGLGMRDAAILPLQHPVSAYTMRLSKRFGLLDGIPEIELNTYTHSRTVGVENDSVTLGFSPPAFEDYFHYQVGELYYWEGEQVSMDPQGFSQSRETLEAITAVEEDANWYKLYFDRTLHLVTDDWYLGTHSDVIYGPSPDSIIINKTAAFDWLLDAMPGRAGFAISGWNQYLPSHPNSVSLFDISKLKGIVQGSDTSIAFYAASSTNELDTALCQVTGVLDNGGGFSFNTTQGITSRNVPTWHGNEELVGSVINGDTIGVIVPVGIGVIHAPSPQLLRAWPNPTTGSVAVSGLRSNETVSLYTSAGQPLLVDVLVNDSQLLLSDFSPGFYILRSASGSTVKLLLMPE